MASSNIEVKILARANLNEKEWDDFVNSSPQGVNYVHSWYLDVVWQGWQGVFVFYKNKLHAVMPLKVSKKYNIHYCYQPALSQYGGIFFTKIVGKTERVLASKKRLVTAIVNAIPKNIKQLVLNFAPEFDYPLPFHWAGFELHTRYSYWLENKADKQAIFKNFNERTRTYINKANKSGLIAIEVNDISDMVQLSQKHNSYNIDFQLLSRLWKTMQKQGVGRAIEVRDEKGHLHAGLIYQISHSKQVHLFSAKDPAVSNLGGMSLAIWQSIQTAGEEIAIHDFEGSMLEPVEHFFRGFGTHPVPYLQITKNNFPKPLQWMFDK